MTFTKPSGVNRRLFLITLLLLSFFFIYNQRLKAAGEIDGSSCPSIPELKAELDLRTEKLNKLKNGLETFMAGNGTAGLPLNVLFTIDLDDAAAVNKRIESLKEEAGMIKAGRPSDPLISCSIADEILNNHARQILALEQAVIDLRLRFLTLAPEKRNTILQPLLEASTQAVAAKELKEKRSMAMEEQRQAAKSLAQAEQKELSGEHSGDPELAAAQTELERVKNELATIQLQWISNLEKETASYQELLEELAKIGNSIITEGNKNLQAKYEEVVTIWRLLVDKTLNIVTDNRSLELPTLPAYPSELLDRQKNTIEANKYIETYNETKNFRDSLQIEITAKLQDSIDRHYRVLLQSGDLRSQLLNQLITSRNYTPFALSTDLLADLRREFAIVPYRCSAFVFTKSIDVNRRLHQGWQGIIEGLTNLFLLLGFLSIPWGMWLLSKHLVSRLHVLRSQLVRLSRHDPSARTSALIIQKLLPYTSWLTMLAAIYLAEFILQKSIFSEFAVILPYFRYYVFYRVFRQLMQFDYAWINQQIKAAKLWDLRKQVDLTARAVGLSVFFIFCLLAITENLTRRGLIYHFMTSAFYYLSILFLMALSYQWRDIIGASLSKLVHGSVGQQLAKLCSGRWGIILSIPALLLTLVLSLFRLFARCGEHFEVTKKIAAQLFRYQLESTLDEERNAKLMPPPKEYQDCFPLSGESSENLIIKPTYSVYDEVLQLVQNWSQHKGAINSLAVIGYKGTGKTCLIRYLTQTSRHFSVLSKSVPAKLITKPQVLAFFGDLLNTPVTSVSDVLQPFQTSSRKTLILIDDAHNFFLAKEGGFEGYRTLIELIERSPAHVFWCLSFNLYAWTYLNAVFNRLSYLNSVVVLPPWTEQAIQELILNLHAKTDYRLSYDDILQAVGSQTDTENVVYVENRFFSLLRHQSHGNPRLAIYLWLTSLNLAGMKDLHVGLPQEPEPIVLSQLSEPAIFIFAAVARHENLKLEEIMAATQITEDIVRQILDMGVRSGLLTCDQNQAYRLSILFHYPLINYLKAKHCLYE